MNSILVAVVSEIKSEANKEELDLVRLSNLVDLARQVQSMEVTAVSEVVSLGPRSPFSGNAARPVAMAYGPSPMERIMQEIIPRILPLYELQLKNATRKSIGELIGDYVSLRRVDPDMAAKAKEKLEQFLTEETEKEKETHEDLHTQPAG